MTRVTRTTTVLRLTAAVAMAFALSACGDDLVAGMSSGSSATPSSASGTIARSPATTAVSTTPPTSTGGSAQGTSAQNGAVAFVETNYSVAANAGSVALTIARTGSATDPVTVRVSSVDGTAVAGIHYEAVARTLEWAENDSTPKTISVPIVNAGGSGEKSFEVVLVDPSAHANVGNPGSATVTITDSAASAASPEVNASVKLATAATTAAITAGTFKLTAPSFGITQYDRMLNILVQRTVSATGAASVSIRTLGQTAAPGVDYTGEHTLLQWANGDLRPQTFSIPIRQTGLHSGTRTFLVQLYSPSPGAIVGSPGSATVTIDEAAPAAIGQIALSAASYSIAQNGGSLKVAVKRTGGSRGKVGVTYKETGKTAVAGTDFTAASGTLSWADGDASAKILTIGISNAKPFAGTRSFLISLSNPTGGVALSTPNSALATIKGDAPAAIGSLAFSAASYPVGQADGAVNIAVHRSGGSAGAITVNYAASSGTAVAGTDFTATRGTLSWADGDAASKSFSVPISHAKAFTGTKSFGLSLSSPSAGASLSVPNAATVTITGSGTTATPPVGALALSSSGYTVGQSAGTLNVSITRTNGSAGAASVQYVTSNGTAVAGKDYTAASGTVQWVDGETATKQVPIHISNATPFSGTKAFTIALAAPTGGATIGHPSSATATIQGSAAPAVGDVALSAAGFTIAQTANALTVSVNRANGSAGAISVQYATSNGSAIAGSDYTASSGTLQWADGDGASRTISIPISNATPFSGTRSFTLALSNPTSGATLSAPSSATVSITGSGSGTSGAAFWVYHNGQFNWAGDYSWNVGTINYSDTTGRPLSGSADIAVPITGAYGGWQPYAQNKSFDTSKYSTLLFCTKPTADNQIHGIGIEAINDVPDGNMINIGAQYGTGGYGPMPQKGVWGCYKVPIANFHLTNPLIQKFSITDGTGNVPNLFYVDDVGFQ